MLDARADVWEAGLAPVVVQKVVESSRDYAAPLPSPSALDGAMLLAGETAQLDKPERFLDILNEVLDRSQTPAGILAAQSGALAFVLGARDVALMQAEKIVEAISDLDGDLDLIIADGPETAWALQVVYPQLGINLDERIEVRTLSSLLSKTYEPQRHIAEKFFYHDSRAAFLIAESQPNHMAVLPGYSEDESAYGTGEAYEAPRRILGRLGVEQVFGTWTRGLAKSCGADDGLWKTYPHLAAGLARQRLDYAAALGAGLVVCDSPLCASFLESQLKPGDPEVHWLPELLFSERNT
jgi:Fe-S oxidoreductase